jgi:PAS domain S-box-containing protein
MIKRINQLLEVSTSDPEDARRRKLLNIILTGVACISLVMLLITAAMQLFGLVGTQQEVVPIYIISGGFLIVSVGLYAMNRYISGWIASLAFLVLLTTILPFTDVPQEVASGRTLFTFTIPIVMAGVLLRPSSTFWFAMLSSIEVSLLAFSIGDVPNFPAILGFFMIAIIVWLSARSLEVAIRELTLINRELDQRVMERTQALSEALTRERTEAGRSQAILHGIADGVMVFDNSKRIILANPAAETLLGQPVNNLLGISFNQWLGRSSLEQRDREAVTNLFQDPSTAEGSLKVSWGKKTLAMSVAPVMIGANNVIGQVTVLHDFTREAEVDRMKSDFVAMVSHELRTPLNSILGYADMLREGVYGRLEDRQLGIMDRMMANTHKLLTIVNDLLAQAQIEAGRLSFHPRLFRPTELTDYVNGGMEGIVQAKKLKLVMKVAPDLPPWLYGDPQRLNQVLVNLVNNAVKFTDEGEVRVSLYRCDHDHWAMEVSDTGAGIPQEAQGMIFEPFRQVDTEVTRRLGGIGLGLSIVRRLINLMQGEITVKSEVGHGSVFTVVLPLSETYKEKSPND